VGVVFAGAVRAKAMRVRRDPAAATVLDGSPGAPRAGVVDHTPAPVMSPATEDAAPVVEAASRSESR
jgi:hypothetical protein